MYVRRRESRFIECSDRDFVLGVCQAFKEKHTIYPVILLDLEGDYAPERVASAAKALGHLQKFLTSDNAVAHSISDISAIAVASSVADPRAAFVDIPELSHVDATAMLHSIVSIVPNSNRGDVDIASLVGRVGGNPAVLKRLFFSPSRLETEEETAFEEIQDLIGNHPAHKKALFELATKATFQ